MGEVKTFHIKTTLHLLAISRKSWLSNTTHIIAATQTFHGDQTPSTFLTNIGKN